MLTEEAENAGVVTVVSRSGNTRLLDFANGRQNRLPIEGGSVMALDGEWRPLHHARVSPCGVELRGEIDWAMGTQLWLVLAGLVIDWHVTAIGQSVIDAIADGRRPETTRSHPRATSRRIGSEG